MMRRSLTYLLHNRGHILAPRDRLHTATCCLQESRKSTTTDR